MQQGRKNNWNDQGTVLHKINCASNVYHSSLSTCKKINVNCHSIVDFVPQTQKYTPP